jgi:hypothetical protein
MAQKPRTIHPGDAQDERLANLPLSAAYTYAYLPTVLDDEGRARFQPAVFNGYLWPLRADEHPTEAMTADLDALAGAGLLCRYSVEGQDYVHDPNWKARQKTARPAPSTLPGCAVHEKSLDEVVQDTLGKVSDQLNSFLATASSSIDEAKVRDSVARIVEDVTFLVDPEKAAAYGQKVRGFLSRGIRAGDRPAGPSQSSGPASADGPGNGRSTWRDATDQPPTP